MVYFDINGLKEVNDSRGHSAGDLLIKNAARNIAKGFNGDTYRIGGDEFVVIKTDVEKEDFERSVKSVVAGLNAEGISVSYGASWLDECNDIEQQLAVADKLMYSDKLRYYKSKNS